MSVEEPREIVTCDLRIALPNHALFVGASQSGKSTLALFLITHPELFYPKPVRILFYYDQFQDEYAKAKEKLTACGIELLLYKGLPKDFGLNSVEKLPGQTILLIDDFSEETSSSPEIARIFTNGRHKNLSCYCIRHQLFSKHSASRTQLQNTRYFFFLPSVQLESQLRTFGSQLGMKNQIVAAFKQCVESKDDFRYLLLDVGPFTPNILRLRTRVHRNDVQVCFSD